MSLVSPIQKVPGLYAVRGWLGCCHVLVHGKEVVLLDTGLWGEHRLALGLLRELGLGPENIQAILLTHGHLDHAGNLHRWLRHKAIPVYAHPAEQAHVDGTWPYRGASRLCGWMERMGGAALGYRPARITHPLRDGEELPYWGGLRVVHLPGHTAGHCGFYSERLGLLFSGDLFASYFFNQSPPAIFLNSEPERLAASCARVRALQPRGMVPNHYDVSDPELHVRRFAKFVARQP